ncbi:MAG: TonB-dependent receptor [Cellulophaga sp.]
MEKYFIPVWKLLLIFNFFSISLNGQTLTQTIKGTVVDAETGIPLMGTTIILVNSNPKLGAITDEFGFFKLINVPIGRQSFICNYLGYEESTISEVLVGSAKEISLTIKLIESLHQLNEVVVVASKDNISANNKLATVSARSFSVEETKRFPASVSDPSRMALSFAGVTSSNDATNEIIIRGNAPNQLLWKIEGVEVPEPNHFSEEGYAAGAVSLLSTNMLGNSDFFTGAFPAEYGNALSGVFDIKLRNGNADKNEFAFQFGVLGTDLAIEGPFSENYRGSYLVNYRYSTLTILNKIIEVSEGTVPTFQDLSFKVNLPLSAKTNLSIWGIGGISENNQDNAEQKNLNIFEDEDFDSHTYMSGINLKHFFNSHTTLDAVLSYSGNRSNYKFILNETNPEGNNFYQEDLFMNSALRFSTSLTQKFNAKTTLKSGVVLSALHYNVLSEESYNNVKNSSVKENGNGNMSQFYSQIKYRFNDKISSTFGLHATNFSINNDFVIEPRGGFEYKVAPKHTFSAGFGVHSRRMPLNQYFVKIKNNSGTITTPNTNLKLMRSFHYILGYDWRILKNGHLKIEGYYQDIDRVAIAANPASTVSFINGEFLDEELVANGKAKSYGVELTFEKFFSDQYYFLITSSLFNSKYRAKNGIWYDSSYNYEYTFNLVGGKEFTIGKTKNNLIGISAKTLLNGGKKGTPMDIDGFNRTGFVYLLQNQRNTIQFKEYFRLDTSIYYRINKSKIAHIISLDIQNITNRQNIDTQFFNPQTGVTETEYQLSLLPLLNYRIEF